jgi:hypothetical protein
MITQSYSVPSPHSCLKIPAQSKGRGGKSSHLTCWNLNNLHLVCTIRKYSKGNKQHHKIKLYISQECKKACNLLLLYQNFDELIFTVVFNLFK